MPAEPAPDPTSREEKFDGGAMKKAAPSVEVTGALPLVSKDALVEAMERTGWVQAKAARILGLTPRQIGYALEKHGAVD